MQKKLSFGKTVVFVIFIIFAGAFSILWYSNALHKNLAKSIFETIEEIIMQQKSNLVLDINADINTIENIAKVLERDLSTEEAFQILDDLIPNTNFQNMYLIGLDGIGASQNYSRVDVSQREYFQRAVKGEPCVGLPVVSQLHGRLVTPLAAPIFNSAGEVEAVLVGSYTIGQVESLLLPTFGGNGRTDIIDSDGNAIATTRTYAQEINAYHANFFEKLSDAVFLEGTSLETAKEDLQNGRRGRLVFSINGVRSYAHYLPLDINDWYMMLVVNHDVIAGTTMQIQNDALKAAILLVICFAIIFIYIYFSNRRHTKHLYQLAYFDKLTGLPNNELFKAQINQLLKSYPRETFSCVIFDVRNFKFINDTYGVKTGDKMLRAIAKLIEQYANEKNAVICRLHSDTFAVFAPSNWNKDGSLPKTITNKEFAEKINFIGDYKIDLALGRYVVQQGDTADVILERANLAHANAAALPPNTFMDYTEEHRDFVNSAVMVRNKMQAAFEKQEFVVLLQPKYCIETEKMCGAEALVRWQQDGVYLPPASFIPAMERNGMIEQLDLYVFEQCCALLAKWQTDNQPLVPLSVNFSRHHLRHNDLADKLLTLTSQYGVDPKQFIVEFTETVTIDYQDAIKQVIAHLHEHGFSVSMDDFGCGYSSLGFLGEISVDEIKLDRSFVQNIVENPKASIIVKNIIAMAAELGISVVAEGVETHAQKEVLQEMRCAVAQGYYYSQPVPAEQIFAAKAAVR